MSPRVVFGSITTFNPFGSFVADQVLLDIGGRGIERFALRNRHAALVVLETRFPGRARRAPRVRSGSAVGINSPTVRLDSLK